MRRTDNLFNKKVVHNFCINTIEEIPEDKTVLRFKAVVIDFKVSHNGWAISEITAEKYMYTLLHKHIVTKYYDEEENGGIDAFGDHEEGQKGLRGTNGEIMIPCTGTHSIGTITNVYIAPLNDKTSEKVLWCEGILLAWDNVNECGLLLEWAEKGIPILVSVEWYYTQSAIDNKNVEWIADPTFSALTVLNSEQRGNKDIVYGSYDRAHIQIMLNNEHYRLFNHAAIKDFGTKKREGEDMDNVFLKALNDISFEGIRRKIYEALEKEMSAKEYKTLWIDMWNIFETYFVCTVFDDANEKHYKIGYEKTEDDAILLDYKTKKQVERKDVYVEVAESQKAADKAEEEMDSLKVSLGEAQARVEELEKENERLEALEDKLRVIERDKKLNDALEKYKKEFAEFDAMDVFLGDEVQELIRATLVPNKQAAAVIKLQEILLMCAKNNRTSHQAINNRVFGGIETACSVGGYEGRLKGGSNHMLDMYGFTTED